jgi:YD repeat-containing protein
MLKFFNKHLRVRALGDSARRLGDVLKPMLLSGGAVAIACLSMEAVAATTVYRYDELGRVTAAEYETVSVSYTYDAADNRMSKQSVAIVPTPITSSMTSVLMHATTGAVLTVNVGGSSPGGTVSFYSGSTFLGSANVVGGTATIEVIDLSLGLHTITATYSGDGSNARSSLTMSIKVVNLDWLPAVLDLVLF